MLAALANIAEDGQRDGQHDHHRCRVRYPHAEHIAGDHEPEHEAARLTPDNGHDAERDAPMQAGTLQAESQQEAAEEEEDDRLAVARGYHLQVGDPQ